MVERKKMLNEMEHRRETGAFLKRLNLSQNLYIIFWFNVRLKQDAEAVRKLRFETRKYLESYWEQQVQLRKHLGDAYE
jgi:hypothetical protein